MYIVGVYIVHSTPTRCICVLFSLLARRINSHTLYINTDLTQSWEQVNGMFPVSDCVCNSRHDKDDDCSSVPTLPGL